MTQEEYYLEKLSRYNYDKTFTHESEMNFLVLREEMNLFSMLKPTLLQDGNQWCCLYGTNLQEGIAGFGNTPYEAILEWNKEWRKPAVTYKNKEENK